MFSERELRIMKAHAIMQRSEATGHVAQILMLYDKDLKPETEKTYSSYIVELNTLIMKLDKMIGPDE